MTVVPLGFSARCSELGRNIRRAAQIAILAGSGATLACAGERALPGAAGVEAPPAGTETPRGAATSDTSATESRAISSIGRVPAGVSDLVLSGSDPSAAPPPPELGPAQCSPEAVWAPGALVASASTSGDDLLGGVTPDEQTIVWSTTVGGRAVALYADRERPTDPFGASQMLALNGPSSPERVAISGDGLRLAAADAARHAFVEWTRPSRREAFRVADVRVLSTISAWGTRYLARGQAFGDPVFAPGGDVFVYSMYGAGIEETMLGASRAAADDFPLGSPVRGSGLKALGRQRRRPNALSTDGRTLFFWDEVEEVERAAWRPAAGWPFTKVATLGPRLMATPNASCERLYYSAPGPSGLDIFVAGR